MSVQRRPTSRRIRRAGQVVLGLLWLTDGAFQFQPYMFGRTFITGVILPSAAGQPGIIGGPITWIARLIEPQVGLFNAGAATLQVLIGLGLIYPRTVKLSLLASFAWAGGIWFAGEGAGMLFTGTASPLTGAPGAAALYLLAGLMCWPAGGPTASRRIDSSVCWCWSAIWLGSAVLWLLPENDTVRGGTAVAAGLATVSAAIGVSFLRGWHTELFLALAIVLSVCFWIIGQDFGGVLTGQATDVGTAPLMVLTAAILLARERTQRFTARSGMIALPLGGSPDALPGVGP